MTFAPNSFETGVKTFLGRTLPALGRAAVASDGPAAVNPALDAVLGHPSHKQYLIRKLWSEFIATPIPDATLAELMAVYDPAGPAAPAAARHPRPRADLRVARRAEPDQAADRLPGRRPPPARRADEGQLHDGALTNMQQRPYRPPNVAGWEGGMSWLNTNTVQGRFDAVVRAQFADLQRANTYPRSGAGGRRRRGGRDGGGAGRARPRVGRPAVAGARHARRPARLRHGGADRQPAQRRQRFYTVQALMLGGPDGQVM